MRSEPEAMTPLEQAKAALKESIDSAIHSAKLGADTTHYMMLIDCWIDTVSYCADSVGQSRGEKLQNEAWERALKGTSHA